ncbi:MAG: rod shape-determining protein MreC [Eubacterium sp.]|nr:rod shape-determining protein MreC [Eubacterium sp.]
MKFDYKKDISPKYLLVFFSAICIVLILLSAFFPQTLKSVRNITGKLITPMQQGVNDAASFVYDKLEVFGDVKKLKKENEKLTNEVKDVRSELDKQQAELVELQELRDMYDLDQLYPDYKKTVARIFSVNTTRWFNEFYISKGLNNGVYEGCNVMSDDGLLGIVVESYDNYAKVRAIIDDRANVTGEIGNTGYICNVEGSLQTMEEGFLYATDIDKSAIINIGDKVVTSSVSDRYLYGITIGYVSSLSQDSNNLTQTAKITPTVNFSDIKDVMVILDRKQEVNY